MFHVYSPLEVKYSEAAALCSEVGAGVAAPQSPDELTQLLEIKKRTDRSNTWLGIQDTNTQLPNGSHILTYADGKDVVLSELIR